METKVIDETPTDGQELQARAFSMYLAGVRTSSIASDLGVTNARLGNWIRRGLWREKRVKAQQELKKGADKSMVAYAMEQSLKLRLRAINQADTILSDMEQTPRGSRTLPARLSWLEQFVRSARILLGWDASAPLSRQVAGIDLGEVIEVQTIQTQTQSDTHPTPLLGGGDGDGLPPQR